MSDSESVQNAEDAVEEKLQTFIDAVADSESYQEFIEVNKQLESDPKAMELLDEYRQKQQQMQQGFDQELMAELQEIQTELSENKTIQQHREAQSALVELLQETNDVISEPIGMEFAQSSGGGCC
ncbi:halo-CC-star protein HcsL [Natronocalculus amylovorans]|uniref:YlbF family regulator n=1 Tax=Natronocalculus amylovorans TaxID=2917812 RepID=A0AAE3FXQ0_9EURY|nr:halo-CC-star protein HcsL [Natronocalculus amylovorans]MCL9817297.1 YlbF family regulator [Natronocalculus amylovorans]